MLRNVLCDAAQRECFVADANPGPEHRFLQQLIGPWETHCKMQFDVGGTVLQCDGRGEFRSLLGGRYVQMCCKVDNLEGMMYLGTLLLGYDRVLRKYFMQVRENFATSCIHAAGAFRPGSSTLVLEGNWNCFMTGRVEQFRLDMTISNSNTVLLEMYMSRDGCDLFNYNNIVMNRSVDH